MNPTSASKTPSELLALEVASTWQWRIDTDPELAASLGMLKQRRSEHALDPRSLASFEKRNEWIDAALNRISTGIPVGDVFRNEAERLCHSLYVKQLEEYSRNRNFRAFLMCVNRLEGPQVDLPLYARYLPTTDVTECEFYRSFLEAVEVQMDENMDLLKRGLEEGRTVPKVSMEGVAEMIRKVAEDGGKQFSDPLKGFPVHEDSNHAINKIKEECVKLIESKVCPAFLKLAQFVESEYTPHLREEISAAGGFPDGDNYYRACLEFHTTTIMTPIQVHELGLHEVARIKSDMENIALEAGYQNLDDNLDYLRSAEEFTPTSGESLCAHFRDICGRISPELLKLFHLNTLPRTPFQITETPTAQASTAPAAYYLAGASDGSRPGIFYVNTSELHTRRTYEAEALALHEAIPGHHLQGAIQGENRNLQAFRRFAEDRRYFEAPCRFPFYTGYIEGWGLHCESLGEELGLYNSPSSRLGQMSMEMLRSCRLVVDTGMHAFGWSRERALQYMLDNTAMGSHDASCEVTRYITWPGQACAYKVGERKIRELRTRAESLVPKDKFDIRDFYDVVLLCGPVPLDDLEDMVDDYIQTKCKDESNQDGEHQNSSLDDGSAAFLGAMTFANWCKCCVVPGTCEK